VSGFRFLLPASAIHLRLYNRYVQMQSVALGVGGIWSVN